MPDQFAQQPLSDTKPLKRIAHDERETFRASSFDFARLKGGGLSMLGVTSRVAPEGIRDDAA